MTQDTAMEIMDACSNLLDTLSAEELTTWNFLTNVNTIVSRYKGIDCLIHMNFSNGNIFQCMCVITDWEPGAIAFQSDAGEFPKMRIVFPEEYDAFMQEIEPLFNSSYPTFPEE